MLKEITRDEVLDLMAKHEPVFMIYELSMEHTIEDILGADGFLMEVPDEKKKPEADAPDKKAKDETDDKPKKGRQSKVDPAKVMELKDKGFTYRMIAQQLGCSEWTVCQIVNKAKKEGKDAERVDS